MILGRYLKMLKILVEIRNKERKVIELFRWYILD